MFPSLTSTYQLISILMTAFGLFPEHSKSEIFHFSKRRNDLNPTLDLTPFNGPILSPKPTWRYLEFYFDWKLTFKEHIRHYSTKALATVKVMGIVGVAFGLPA